MYGPHLTADLYGCNIELIDDMKYMFNFLKNFPKVLEMEIIVPPLIHSHVDSEPLDSGLTGFVVISTSHCSFHAYPHRGGFLSLDAYSCKTFDVELAKAVIIEAFEPVSWDFNLLQRGNQFSRSL